MAKSSQNPMVTAATKRFTTTTIGLWGLGILFVACGLFSFGLIITANAFQLKNEMWFRADNPHTLSNATVYLFVGVAAIIAARSGNKKRLAMLIAAGIAIAAMLIYELLGNGWL